MQLLRLSVVLILTVVSISCATPKKTVSATSSGENASSSLQDYVYEGKNYTNVLRLEKNDYFITLKKQFNAKWSPLPVLRNEFKEVKKPDRDVSVVLGITVDKSGALIDAFVMKSSGFKSYDNESLRTVKYSIPFPKPPKDLLDKDGLVRMAWSFVVYM